MAFKFKFSTLLQHRQRLEEEAKRQYLTAKKSLDEGLARLHQYYNSIETARSEILQAQKMGGSSSINEICFKETFIEGQKLRILHERNKVREWMQVVEQKQETLVEQAREHKKLIKLKERMFRDYKKDQKRKEMKRVEDLVVMRHKRGLA